VTNAVRHGGPGALRVRAVMGTSTLRVEVRDGGQGFDPEPSAPGSDGGYGLLLVREAADRWGVQVDQGSCVWFEMDLIAAG
jgi:signal transduction histidine kinase